jgi:hypothetical protein
MMFKRDVEVAYDRGTGSMVGSTLLKRKVCSIHIRASAEYTMIALP